MSGGAEGLGKNRTYRAFVAYPTMIVSLGGELLNAAPVMSQLASEVRDVSSYATYVVRNDTALGEKLAGIAVSVPAEAGRKAGITMPDFLSSGRTGRSRKEKLLQYNVVTSYRSYEERVNAVNGESSKYVSQGWKRTVNASPPSYGKDYVNLGTVDRAYACIENDPFTDGEIVLKMVVQGAWYRLIFNFDDKRFTEGKVTLPVIKVQDGEPVFIFTVVTDNPVVQFSGDYVIGVDVGVTDYATVVVREVATGRIVHQTTLSQRVHSLWNSVRASEAQVRELKAKAVTLLHDRQSRMAALDEAQFHREAASRKKRELAILAAQEIAYLSHAWGNAVVAVEDLGWIRNTMQHGRWNRGALVQWLTHYVSQNGGWVVAVNPANTSQLCYKCGSKVTHPTHKDSVCPEHGALRLAKELQREYDLPIFAMSFKKACSCCASPANFNREAYLDESVAEKEWDDVDAYVVLRNSCNGAGEARFYHAEAVTEGGKTSRRRVWDGFGTLTGGHDAGGDQYVMYKLSDSFTMDTLRELLTKFVDGLNKAAGFEAYDLVLPDDETECAQIVYA